MKSPFVAKLSLIVVAAALMLAAPFAQAAERISGDSLVLVAETPAMLLGDEIDPATVTVRSTYLADAPGSITYERGRDYRLDAAAGTIARTAGSRIPNFATNMLFGQKDFDHSKFPGFGNGRFFVYVDYVSARPARLGPPQQDVSALLPRTAKALRAGTPIKLIAFGDSITAGGDASSVELQYPMRYA